MFFTNMTRMGDTIVYVKNITGCNTRVLTVFVSKDAF